MICAEICTVLIESKRRQKEVVHQSLTNRGETKSDVWFDSEAVRLQEKPNG